MLNLHVNVYINTNTVRIFNIHGIKYTSIFLEYTWFYLNLHWLSFSFLFYGTLFLQGEEQGRVTGIITISEDCRSAPYDSSRLAYRIVKPR